ncbi:DUF3592 domain-containing protein [Streptomyces sp. NPDC052036]|uniref:DUF3592 domain-containing protein n=1 Tax=unclassified Streptomyces TaxID=2593676 RepID=UPI0034405CB9
MDFFFYAVPGLIMAGVLAMAARVIGRALQLRSNWDSGLTAEARCLRTYTTTSGGHGDATATTTLHHVYEFTTREGRAVRFEERGGPRTTVEGDIVPVHYTKAHPERATAHSPAPGRTLAGTVGTLVFLSVIVAFCVAFMATYHAAAAMDDPFAGMP